MNNLLTGNAGSVVSHTIELDKTIHNLVSRNIESFRCVAKIVENETSEMSRFFSLLKMLNQAFLLIDNKIDSSEMNFERHLVICYTVNN